MLSRSRLSSIICILFLCPALFGQSKSTISYGNTDYKVLASNSSYVELEYYPHFISSGSITINNSEYFQVDFENSVTLNDREYSKPEIKFRPFAVFLPGTTGNTVSIIDYDQTEIKNFRLAPVPEIRIINPGKHGFENFISVYSTGAEYHTNNNFTPENIAEIVNIDQMRDLNAAILRIYPYRYNPAASTLQKFIRIRIRIEFGSRPLLLSKPRSSAEISLIKDAAINSETALSWTGPRNSSQRNSKTAVNSPFASGDWYKIEIPDNGNGSSEGIYKITKSFLESSGINLSNVDPRTIKMYGNGGNPLPDSINGSPPGDIQPIPIYIQGDSDGHFDAQDYILFFARSIHNWNYDSAANRYSHYISPFGNSNFYWICLNTAGPGFRMSVVNSENVSNPLVISSFTERVFTEPELTSPLLEGNLWLSELHLAGDPFYWNLNLSGLAANSDILFTVKPAARVFNPVWPAGCPYYVNFLFKDELSVVSDYTLPLDCVGEPFGDWINTKTGSFTINAAQKTPPNSDQVKLREVLSSNAPNAESYYDWFEIQYSRRLNSAVSDALRFDSPNTNATVEYNVSSFSGNDIKVFDITDNNNVKRYIPISSSASGVRFQKTQTGGKLSSFSVNGPNGYKTPGAISGRVPNQNLHGSVEGASLIIITHPDLIPAAGRIKSMREGAGPNSPNYLKTAIYTCDQIYNEFSGGVIDPVAIRDFIKNAYENWTNKPVYVLLLGDGDIDFKHIVSGGKNWVPPYEITSPQINEVFGYVTDDFFVNVVGADIPEGAPDLSIGRIPARSLHDANLYIDKIEAIENPANNGYWKNKMIFVADDAVKSEGCEQNMHIPASEDLTSSQVPEYIEQYKIYLPSYPTVITAEGRRKPDVNADIIKHWSEGCINVHYIGHGSPEVWAHEYIMEKNVLLSQVTNLNMYPFVTMASCDMSKFDNPSSQSAAELFTLEPLKGALGTLAASRPVYSGANNALMSLYFHFLYNQRDTLMLQKRYGNAAFQTKLLNHSINDLKYILLGDPTMRNELPRFSSHIDSISGLSFDTMRALSRITVHGSVLNPDSTLWASYNGRIIMKIFDVPRAIRLTDQCATYDYVLPGGIIYSGTQNIRNGKWKIEFIVPRDISYQNKNGKIINYFYNNQGDGAGFYKNFIIGGINAQAPADTIGPVIGLYLNSRNFRTGDVVNNNFNLLADLTDESGINTTGTIGHKLEAVLDNDENHKYDLSNFYVSDTSYKSGSLSYQFQNIADGNHRLELRAWDTYNNSSKSNINFMVMANTSLNIVNVYNFPNPFWDRTAFTFEHNYPGLINVRIKIYTVAGRLIKELKRDNVPEKFVVMDWTGTDEDGDALSNGVYIYKVMIDSDNGDAKTAVGKLAKLK